MSLGRLFSSVFEGIDFLPSQIARRADGVSRFRGAVGNGGLALRGHFMSGPPDAPRKPRLQSDKLIFLVADSQGAFRFPFPAYRPPWERKRETIPNALFDGARIYAISINLPFLECT